jgi:signal recognition particle GTPase
MFNKLPLFKSKTQPTYDVNHERATRSFSLPSLPSQSSQASGREGFQSDVRTQPVKDVNLEVATPLSSAVSSPSTLSRTYNREEIQSNIRIQSKQHVDPERQRRRAKNIRRRTSHFHILIIGRANAGKTTILQRVCNTTERPKIFNPQGHEVRVPLKRPTSLLNNYFVDRLTCLSWTRLHR